MRTRALAVARVLAQLRDLEEKLAAASADLDRRASHVTARVLGRIGTLVADEIKRHVVDKNQAGFEKSAMDTLRRIVLEETRAEILSLLTATGGALVPVVNLAEISGFMKFKSLTLKIPKSNRR